MLPQNIDYKLFIGIFSSVIVAITVHEYAHAKIADRAGDATPRTAGRISLNPLDHLDVLGTLMIIWMSLGGFGIGWGKPVPVNPFNFDHPRRDDIKVSLAGIVANLLLAAALAIPLRFGVVHPTPGLGYYWLLRQIVEVNVIIAFFNLIPIPPLDGSHVLANLLPVGIARAYSRAVGRFGFLLLVLLLVSHTIGLIIGPPAYFTLRLLLG